MRSKNKPYAALQITLAIVAGILILWAPQIVLRRHYSENLAQPLILSPTELNSEFYFITSGNVLDMQEVTSLIRDTDGVVLKLAENENRNKLQAVYQDGQLVKWGLRDRVILSSQQVFNNGSENTAATSLPLYQLSAGMSFNENGTVLIAPEAVLIDRLGDYVYWDLANNLRIQGSGGSQIHAVHPNLDIVFFAGETSVAMEYGLVSEPDGQFSGLFQGRDSKLTGIAIDPLGDFLAISDDSGCVTIGDISRVKRDGQIVISNPLRSKTSYHCYSSKMKDPVATVDLIFDSTHTWLAWLTDENLTIWSLANYVFPLHMRLELIGANTMSFDRAGEILAIGTEDGIVFIDLVEKKQIAQYKVGEVTTLYFTRDNRLLIWGDAHGTVHLWGVK